MIHLPDRPIQETADFESYQDRRQFLSTAAMGIVSASAASLLSTHPASPAESGAIRPFRVNIPNDELVDLRKRVLATRWPDRETVADPVPGRAAHDDRATRAVLGDGIRLAEGRSAAQRLAAIHHRDRRAGHSFHSRSFEA